MAVTLAQIEAQLDAAWAAFQVGQASYTFNGRTITLRSLDEMHRHIDWLEGKKRQLTQQAEVAAGTRGSPVVKFQEASS